MGLPHGGTGFIEHTSEITAYSSFPDTELVLTVVPSMGNDEIVQ